MTVDHETDSSPAGPASEDAPRARTPHGFAIAVALVSVMFVGVAAVGIGAVIASGHQPHMQVAVDGSVELNSMPTWMAGHYRFAAAHARLYDRVPCFCGCEATLEHGSLLDCFVRPAGGWERHASGCVVCIDESEMVRSMLARGSPMQQIRAKIVAAYTMDP